MSGKVTASFSAVRKEMISVLVASRPLPRSKLARLVRRVRGGRPERSNPPKYKKERHKCTREAEKGDPEVYCHFGETCLAYGISFL